MADCFLYFRCWPGFSEPFPVDRFNAIADDEDLVRALDSYAREEIGRPEVRRQIKQTAKERRRKLLAALRKPRGVYANRPAGFPNRPTKRVTKRDWYWPRIRQAERRGPLVCRLGAYLGWWQEAWFESLPFGPRVWFCRVSSPELARTFVSLLNGRTGVDYDGNEVEHELRPRFGFVEDADAALQIVARRCINAIRHGGAPDVRGSKAALAMGQKAMAIADEMSEAPAPPTPDRPTGNAGCEQEKSNHETKGGPITVSEANSAAMKLAKQDRAFVNGVVRKWADAISRATGKTCSIATVQGTAFWQDTMRRTGRGKGKGKSKKPTVVSLTDTLESVIGQGGRDDVLNKLIAQQDADAEPSPLDDDPPERPRKTRCRKQL